MLVEMLLLSQSLFWNFKTSCLVLLKTWEGLVLSFQKPGSLVAWLIHSRYTNSHWSTAERDSKWSVLIPDHWTAHQIPLRLRDLCSHLAVLPILWMSLTSMNLWFHNSTDQTLYILLDQLEVVFTSSPDTSLLSDPSLLQWHCTGCQVPLQSCPESAWW